MADKRRASDDQVVDLAVYVGGKRQRVTVTAHTTCRDLICTLLQTDVNCRNYRCSRGGSTPVDKKFAIVERWEDMDKALEPDARILKIWNSWGRERDKVKFILKRHSTRGASSQSPEPSRGKVRRSKRRSSDCRLNDVVKQLVRVLDLQERTINKQVDQLKHNDGVIQDYEEKLHLSRVSENGDNYLIDSYMPLPEACVGAEVIEAYEKLLSIRNILTTEQGKVTELVGQIQHQAAVQQRLSLVKRWLDEQDEVLPSDEVRTDEEILTDLRKKLEQLSFDLDTNESTIEKNRQQIDRFDTELDEKNTIATGLESELAREEQSHDELIEALAAAEAIAEPQPPPIVTVDKPLKSALKRPKEYPKDFDENSDTGISSTMSCSTADDCSLGSPCGGGGKPPPLPPKIGQHGLLDTLV